MSTAAGSPVPGATGPTTRGAGSAGQREGVGFASEGRGLSPHMAPEAARALEVLRQRGQPGGGAGGLGAGTLQAVSQVMASSRLQLPFLSSSWVVSLKDWMVSCKDFCVCGIRKSGLRG